MAVGDFIAQGKDNAPCGVASFVTSAAKLVRTTLYRFAPKPVEAGRRSQLVRRPNGSEFMIDSAGRIISLKDAEGRAWRFEYDDEEVRLFQDPHGETWRRQENEWRCSQTRRTEPITGACVNQETGDIRLDDSVRSTVYRSDGSKVITVYQTRNGVPVTINFIEYATHPTRAFVVVENDPEGSRVTWIQDANAKLYKLEYCCGRMYRYTDLSSKPAIVWTAHFDDDGNISAWLGERKRDRQPIGLMEPKLDSVDLAGNRHFLRSDGTRFTVGPGGVACSDNLLDSARLKGRLPLLSF